MPTNTVIITDAGLVDPANDDLLTQLLAIIESILPPQRAVRISKLKFFKRVVMVFQSQDDARQIRDILAEYKVGCDFSLRDNKFVESENTLLEAGQPQEVGTEALPTNVYDGVDRLEPPPNTIQMKSPPASPYLGWVNEPEDAPDEMTVTNPRSLAKLLYEPGEAAEMRRVFSHTGESDVESIASFDLGEGVEETEVEKVVPEAAPEVEKVEPKVEPHATPSPTPLQVPILVIGKEEADHLREVSRELEIRGSPRI